jgi:hypothetical protein
VEPSSLLNLKDSFQSGGAAQSGGPQTVEILSREEVQASIEALASALEAEGQAIEGRPGTTE